MPRSTLTKPERKGILAYLDDRDGLDFPDPREALTQPNGLLAVGGDLSVPRLLKAYSCGVFPWFNASEPFLWWSPDPRCVIYPADYSPSRSLRKVLRQARFQPAIDRDFAAVIRACQQLTGAEGTWITAEMEAAYLALHQAGAAHSIECYEDGQLVGGLYGVALGRVFFGESMFHRVTDASKVAFSFLMGIMHRLGSPLVDCQLPNPHLFSLGAELISRDRFLKALQGNADLPAIDWEQTRLMLAEQPAYFLEHQLGNE